MSISTVTSEALQLKLRQLLPSQQGFGTDLSASDTIIPIIDLTGAAAGTDTPIYQSQAIGFSRITSFDITGGTTALANATGFWRFYGVSNARSGNATVGNVFTITDGASTKQIWAHKFPASATTNALSAVLYDFTVFLKAGESVSGQNFLGAGFLTGSYYQLADINGVEQLPTGFTPS